MAKNAVPPLITTGSVFRAINDFHKARVNVLFSGDSECDLVDLQINSSVMDDKVMEINKRIGAIEERTDFFKIVL